MGKKFVISIVIDETLDIDQLWPDGDAPENPTADDVLLLIEDCGGAEMIIRDWNFEPEVDVYELPQSPKKFA